MDLADLELEESEFERIFRVFLGFFWILKILVNFEWFFARWTQVRIGFGQFGVGRSEFWSIFRVFLGFFGF